MDRPTRRTPSFATIIALLALVVAMGGTGYALALPKNSVGSKQIINSSIKSNDIKNDSLKAKDFKAGELATPFGQATVQFFQATADLVDGDDESYSVFCPAGQQAIAGGGRGDDTLSEQTVLTNTRPAISESNQEPPTDGQGFTGWRITIFNPPGGAAAGVRPEVWAVCVDAP